MIPTNPDALLIEFESLERVLEAYPTLRLRRDYLEKQIDVITQPQRNVRTGRGYEYRGQFFPTTSMIDLYLGLIGKIWHEFADKREAVSKHLKRVSYSRSYIANSRTALFTGWPESKARQYSAAIGDGWFVDKNVSRQQMERVLDIVIAQVGLRRGIDVSIFWK